MPKRYGWESLIPPYSQDHERLVRHLQDEKRLRSLFWLKAKKWNFPEHHKKAAADEFVSIAGKDIARVVREYDPEHESKAKFSTYFLDSVRGWAKNAFKRTAPRAVTFSALTAKLAQRHGSRGRVKSFEELVASKGAGPAQQAQRKELRKIVRDEISELKKRHRRIIRLVAFKGLSHAEAAERLGLKNASSSSQLYNQALRRLRKRLLKRGFGKKEE